MINRASDGHDATQPLRGVAPPTEVRGAGCNSKSGSRVLALRQPVPRRTAAMLAAIAPALLLIAWCLATYGPDAVSSDFLPSPTDVLAGMSELFSKYELGLAIWPSTRRIAFAFLIASSVAFPLGVLMGSFDVVNRLLEPIVAPLRYMPISAFIPLL